jgi:hypothetical protein
VFFSAGFRFDRRSKLWGMGLSRIWFARDFSRLDRRGFVALTLANTWVRPGVSPRDPPAAQRAIREAMERLAASTEPLS